MTTIVVMAKAPVAGSVKTRLCPPCSPEEAARLAAAALADTLAAVARAGVGRRVLALDGAPCPPLPRGFEVIAQRGRGLDERLGSAAVDVGGPLLLIGMDTPQVTPALLTRAAAALGTRGIDAVVGPALDGGWWALGLRQADPRAVLGVPMSTPVTLAAQRRRLARLELVTAELPALRDADTAEDALAVAADAPQTRFAAAVRRVLVAA